MHWWKVALASSSKTLSDDDSVIVDGNKRYFLKPRFFGSRRSSNLVRRGKLPLATGNDDGETCRRSGRFERSPARSVSALPQPQPQPLPLPELQLLMRRDPKFASSGCCSVPLPSPESVRHRRGGSLDTYRERDEERQRTDALIADAIDGLNGLKSKLLGQQTRTNVEHCDTRSSRDSKRKGNAKRRSSSSCSINFPSSAPSSPTVSPSNGDMFAIHYMTTPSVFHVWSAPEMPYSDGNLGLSSYYQMSSEKTASSLENSPRESPRLSFRLHGISPPKSTSPMCAKISPETPAARWECNAPACVHPLPRPPGPGTPTQTTSTSQVLSASDLSAASMPLQATTITTLSAIPEFPGANISSQPSAVSHVAVKPELMPIKCQWKKGKLIGRGHLQVSMLHPTETGALCAMKEVEILPDDSKSAESMKQLEQHLASLMPKRVCVLLRTDYLSKVKTKEMPKLKDIKGANLLVDAYGVVKLADFGMSKNLNGQVANLSLKGSPHWLAPELLQSEMQKDTSIDLALAVDIWSLGCTVIEMMNGKPPWSEYEGLALFKVLMETPPIPETLSADGKDFLNCCFRRNPAERPTAIKLLDHPFVNYSQQSDGCTQPLKELRLTVNYSSNRFSFKVTRHAASGFLSDNQSDFCIKDLLHKTRRSRREAGEQVRAA
ncbi:Mitogen-activated protein kinase kinase kinase [Sesamum angolense]|uniref:Mitogen-activated protein kinase kinase kinase n=1 Tax=Sesamum angolense TaxID=2727404 RepID=A0AAE2C5D0_9LAMI|nr:Mitogen-activated protein kinase kinase kinase [Sesamum angolense]